MCADNSTLGASGKTIEDLDVKLNSDMAKVNKWCKDNKIAINYDKTKVMLITTYKKEAKLDSTHVSVICDNTELENVNSNKLLDVIIDKNLIWKFHIDKTAKSICHNIAILRRIRKYLPHQTRMTFYKSYIQPHIDYCNTVWGQSPHVNRIHILQKMVLRLIMNVPNLTHSAPLFHQSAVMPIQSRVKFRTVITLYKSLNRLTPDYMKNRFEKV